MTQINHLGIVILLLSVVAASLIMPETSHAQSELHLEQLQIDLWPEHDRPEMLIIYRGSLPADAPLPATITMRIPARVGEPSAVAYNDASGDLLLADYSTTTTDDWLAVTLETPERDFQLEFYDSLERTGDQRSYTFVWPGDYAVDRLSYILLPPSEATDIQTQPELLPLQQETGGSIYGVTIDSLAAGQESQVTVSYRGGPATSPETLSLATDEQDGNLALIAGVGVVGLALVIGGVVWYTRRTKPQAAKILTRQRRQTKTGRRAPKRRTTQDRVSTAAFCTKCGRPVGIDDRFCGYCGTQVKDNSK